MRLKFHVLTILGLLFISVSASGGERFGPEVESDTTIWSTVQNFLLSPFALTDYNFLGGGAKARGMGGAFFAVSDDPTAASWNPAGLSQLDQPQMNLSFSSYMHRTDYTSTLDAPNLGYSFSDKLKYHDNSISFASVVIPFKIRGKDLVGGVLYQRLADIYQENKYAMVLDSAILSSATGYDTATDYVLPHIDEKVTGNLSSVSISIGGQAFKSLSLGASANIFTGKFTSDANFFAPFSYSYAGGILPIDATGNGRRFHPHIVSDYSGLNFTLGAMYKLDKLRLAGVVKTPFTLKEDIDAKLFVDVVQLGVISDAGSRFFKTDRKWKMPTMIGVGGSYQINSLTLAADLEFRNYSKTEVSYRRNIADPSGTEVTTGGYLTDKWWGSEGSTPPFVPSLGWRDLTQFRIGGEYMINTKYGNIPLRVGFRNDPKLFTDRLDSSDVYLRMDYFMTYESDTLYEASFVQSDYGVEKGSWVNGNILSLGTGIAWSRIELDLTFEFARYPDVKKQTSTFRDPFISGAKYPPREGKTFLEKQSSNFDRIMISFTGFF
jgi:long-subunit fatty acid transport protein